MTIRECRIVQIQEELPWFKGMLDIANRMQIDLLKARETEKEEWKRIVKQRINEKIKQEITEEIGNTKRYKENVDDEIIPGKPKKYMNYNTKTAEVFFRARADILDPAPRNPYHPESIWKCKFCDGRTQGTYHYIVQCEGVSRMISERNRTWTVIKTLDADDVEMRSVGNVLRKLFNRLNAD